MYKNLNDYEIIYLVKENRFSEDENLIYSKYLPLMKKHAKKYLYYAKRCGLELEDLLQVEGIALFKAVNSFNDYNGAMFYTYVNRTLENAIIGELRNNTTKKREVLNNSLSFDRVIDETNVNFLDFLSIASYEDDLDFWEYEYNLIKFKNTLSFDCSCVFELRYSGYKIKEISFLLDMNINIVKKYLIQIKKLLLYK